MLGGRAQRLGQVAQDQGHAPLIIQLGEAAEAGLEIGDRRLHIAPVELDGTHVVEHCRGTRGVTGLGEQGEGAPAELDGRAEVALVTRQVACGLERPGPNQGRAGSGQLEDLREPSPSFGEMPVDLPEPPQRARETLPGSGLSRCDRVLERGPQVGVFGGQDLQP